MNEDKYLTKVGERLAIMRDQTMLCLFPRTNRVAAPLPNYSNFRKLKPDFASSEKFIFPPKLRLTTLFYFRRAFSISLLNKYGAKGREKQTKVRGGKTLVIEDEHGFQEKLSIYFFLFQGFQFQVEETDLL